MFFTRYGTHGIYGGPVFFGYCIYGCRNTYWPLYIITTRYDPHTRYHPLLPGADVVRHAAYRCAPRPFFGRVALPQGRFNYPQGVRCAGIGLLYLGMHLQPQQPAMYPTPYELVFKVGPSKIHGRGLMAARDIDAGETIGVAVGFKASHPYLTDMARYVNHSGHPNSKLQPVAGYYNLVAIAPIKTDEEILADYNDTPPFLARAQPDYV